MTRDKINGPMHIIEFHGLNANSPADLSRYVIEDLHPKTQFKEYLLSLAKEKKYGTIYTCLGGKWNESDAFLPNHTIPTNATYQMVPKFIRDLCLNKALVIVIDSFRNEDQIKQNRMILHRLITKSQSFDVVLLNIEITTHSIGSIIESIIGFSKYNKIDPNQYMFCNYIRFAHPNEIERSFEERLPGALSRYHCSTAYSNGVYQWHGYHTQLYNTVHRFSKYNYLHVIYRSKLNALLSKMKNMQLTLNNIIVVQMTACNRSDQDAILSFMEHNYDITSGIYDKYHMATSYLEGNLNFAKVVA